ncbi:MAG: methionine adenosyltransferase [Candidatus Jettenia sp.]|uniref:S-adenosylmethionine synthase n=1 Tax=Candidatus Jettenia caeni TaxID=247490 RepID=I3IPQ0_9BACT|nr:methionine adenosyltransferase [Candidatus Jettenia sp. AMX1]MBC6929165.1 methionine adenosyltransferase [Candidatus Jettenia sp.]NUN22700.1 methionine adenosyltransferase [Candidatus Jettenia caeni]KAA0250223.1 MAG: methionine adenosyltransferase [Candidatus Jettenia sp. AMX1]MCE7880520.1 methionine adenosyltransferase [Candidatus Jettenia sp. AMX1]MCQ3927321.1 methionine adenosyltransferase [Candidatus Jettenia sp.]
MKKGIHLFTSESVSMGHPDKVADQISDAVLDAMLEQDPMSRVACETMVTTGVAFVAGEFTTKANVNIPDIVRNTVKEIGYTDASIGFDYNTCAVITSIGKQSPDISQGVSGEGLYKEEGAGDQGMMFGYACNDTPELMPLPIMLAHRIIIKLAELRQNNIVKYLRPDAKSQVTVEYKDHKPIRVHTVVVSTQHAPDVTYQTIKEDMVEKVIKKVIPADLLDSKTIYHINPTGRFVIGGPQGDCGLTGRKIIVDTYGGWGRHGGGAFSGKDPTKVDRSACYAARHIAKNVVASGLADRCEAQVAYAIGVAKPLAIHIYTEGTGKIADEKLTQICETVFDMTPKGIIERLKLRRPVYKITARHGHFGRPEDTFTWEKTDMVEALRKAAGI